MLLSVLPMIIDKARGNLDIRSKVSQHDAAKAEWEGRTEGGPVNLEALP